MISMIDDAFTMSISADAFKRYSENALITSRHFSLHVVNWDDTQNFARVLISQYSTEVIGKHDNDMRIVGYKYKEDVLKYPHRFYCVSSHFHSIEQVLKHFTFSLQDFI